MRRLVAPLGIAALALIAAPAAQAGTFLPEGGSPGADSVRTLYIMVALLALVIFLGVEGLLIYSMLKFRARKGRVAAQIHGNTRLEIGWTVGAALILVFITVFTFILLDDVKNPAASEIDAQGNPVATNAQYASTDQPPPPAGSAPLNVHVDGLQYVWRFTYPAEQGETQVFSYQDMYVPIGRTVTLDITSDDVAHSWWIPQLGGKMDAVPGYENHFWFQVPLDALKEGESRLIYEGQCAELCGRNHANMYARVIALPADEWQRWYDEKRTQIKQAQQEAADARKQLEQSQGPAAEQGGATGPSQGTED